MARYNYTATILNNSSKTLNFAHYCKGEYDHPKEGEHGELYHGKMVSDPTGQIPPNRTGAFTAKSTGSTIQGTVVYHVEGGSDIWMYFHVPLGDRHRESSGVAITKLDDSDHSVVQYTVTV